MEPTCIYPPSIRFAATHTIRSVMQYMIIIIPGIINVITRLVNNCVFVRLRLASSNRSSSRFSRPNARITFNHVRISLETRFSRSTRFCIILNFGMAREVRSITNPRITSTASAITHSIPAWVCATLITPPIPMIGA